MYCNTHLSRVQPILPLTNKRYVLPDTSEKGWQYCLKICGVRAGGGGAIDPQFRRSCLSKTYTLSLPLSAKFNVPTLILLCTKKVRKEKRISSKVIMVSYPMLSLFGSTLTKCILKYFFDELRKKLEIKEESV